MEMGGATLWGMELTIDTPPTQSGSSAEQSTKSAYSCIVCQTPLTYSGRGRHPKYCDVHRPTKTASGGRKSASIDALVEQIATFYTMAGFGLTMYKPLQFEGMVVSSEASKLAESWRSLLESNPKVRKVWERMFTASAYGSIVTAHLAVLLPIAQHRGLLPGATTENGSDIHA